MKVFKDSVEKIDGTIITVKKNCELCGKTVKMYQRKYDRPYKFVFINITQQPQKHYFCSKKCKTTWVFKPKKRQIVNLDPHRAPNSEV